MGLADLFVKPYEILLTIKINEIYTWIYGSKNYFYESTYHTNIAMGYYKRELKFPNYKIHHFFIKKTYIDIDRTGLFSVELKISSNL